MDVLLFSRILRGGGAYVRGGGPCSDVILFSSKLRGVGPYVRGGGP